MSILYVDHAATTPMTPTSLQALYEASANIYGNPSSVHGKGREAAGILKKARAEIAGCLGGDEEGVIFTSGGSEADNQAILTAVSIGEKTGRKHMITTVIEHHAILHTMKAMEKKGFEVTYLPVKENGIVDPELVKNAIRKDTVLVSVMMANNEIGTIQPIEEIGNICREKGVLFHTDAVQAVGHMPIDLNTLPVDMLSLSAHKFHGPKGTGVLYVRKELAAESLIHGGGQEQGRRAGTENIPGIASMAAALKEACENLEQNRIYVKALQKKIIDGLLEIPGTRLNGDREKRLCGNIHVSFRDVESEMLLLLLDEEGIEASSGSACTAGSVEPSHVIKALGVQEEWLHGSLRLSICEMNTMEEAEILVDAVADCVEEVREIMKHMQKGK